ncbi:MAG: hypothetical protein ACI87E_004157, partial [Mariniblastus sp.]
MIRTKKTIRVTLLALSSIALLLNSGCKPIAKESISSTNSGVATSEPKTKVAYASTGGQKQDADGEPVLISGDLGLVDWRSMLGQEITVTGDLMVVDTYDLVRRGQVKVARNRPYIPTNRIDPNDADPNATTFEGGSNVANVTKAQKYIDKATIIIDDGS